MFWEVGVIKLTANRRQFSPISLKRGNKQAKLPDPLWDEGHYRIGFRRPSQVEESRLSSCLMKTISTAETKCKPGRMNKFGERITTFCPSYLHRDKSSPAQNHRGKIPGAGRRVQCGAQPNEASNTLTRWPATYNRILDSRTQPTSFNFEYLKVIYVEVNIRILYLPTQLKPIV